MKHPTEPQRYKISAFIEAGLNKTQIAQKLNVHKSTITREIQRNGYGRYRNYKSRDFPHRTSFKAASPPNNGAIFSGIAEKFGDSAENKYI